jgi:hypothetical protein
MAPPAKLDPAWVGDAYARRVGGETLQSIAASCPVAVSHQHLSRLFRQIAADAEVARLEARAKARAAKAAEPRAPGEPFPVPGPPLVATGPLEPPEGAPPGAYITPNHSAVIGSWYADTGPEVSGSELLPGASLVATREVWSDDRPNLNLSDRVRAKAVEVAEQKAAEAARKARLAGNRRA